MRAALSCTVLTAFALAGGAVPADAEIYKCTDASGHRTFTDRPCPRETAAEVLDIDASSPGEFNGARFVRRLIGIARHGDLADRRRIERALGIAIREPPPDAQWRGYQIEGVPPALEVLAIQYAAPSGAAAGSELTLTIHVDGTRACIAPEVAIRDLGEPARSETTSGSAPDGSVLTSVRRWYAFPARHPGTLELLVASGTLGSDTCVEQLVLSEKRAAG